MATIEVNGARLAYDDVGSGTPVVLLHAGIADRRMWRGLVEMVAPPHRAITVDLRGYGDSELPPAPFAHHDDVAGLLDALDLPRAVLVGCSFGGAVAIDTALAHPDRVAALVLFGSAVSGAEWSAETTDLWDRLVGDVDEADLAAVAAGEVRFWVVGPDRRPADVDPGLLAFARAMDERALAAEAALSRVDVIALDPPAIERLDELRMPVVVTAGAADIPDVRRLADRVGAEARRGVRREDVPGAAHLLPLERPDQAGAILSGLLDEFVVDPDGGTASGSPERADRADR